MEQLSTLNEIQDEMLRLTSLCRDHVMKVFVDYGRPDSVVDMTLNRFFSYFSQRSQVVCHLTSIGYHWDAEIILRSFMEAAAKIWLICLHPNDQRENLVEEFLYITEKVDNRKMARRANITQRLSQRINSTANTRVMEIFNNNELFEKDELNKKARKELETKWSFSVIISYLEQNHPADFPMKDIESLLHTYGMGSHLLHSDRMALDLMLDRSLREPEELDILTQAHCTRIWSDLAWLWYISLTALKYRFEIGSLKDEIYAEFKMFADSCQKIKEKFDDSQNEFYKQYLNEMPPK